MQTKKLIMTIITVVVLVATILLATLLPLFSKSIQLVAPTCLSTHTATARTKPNNVTYFVSTTGNDQNDGSKQHPFATIQRAQQAVRALPKNSDITVAIMQGTYNTNGLYFDSADSGNENCRITYCDFDGKVVLNGGVQLDSSAFSKVTNSQTLQRLNSSVANGIYCVNLFEQGLTSDNLGKIYPQGVYSSWHLYKGETVGAMHAEVFVNGQRQTLARYPNGDEWLQTTNVVQTGKDLVTDYPIETRVGDIYQLDDQLAQRINGWANLDDVWMYGYRKYTWAGDSTPIASFDYQTKQLETKFFSWYGTSEQGIYYLFNILEELDTPGEYYIDRNNGMLYVYPGCDISSANVTLSLTTSALLTLNNCNYVTFDGIDFGYTRGTAVNIVGSNNKVTNCNIYCCGSSAINVNGSNNVVQNNEISNMGQGGVTVEGGDRTTLTPGNNLVDNNSIHDICQVSQTTYSCVSIGGVGNVCSHNEMYNSPYGAITYSGNNHLIEYNYIHHVCTNVDDWGAIYSGRRWDCYGTVIKSNCIYHITTPNHNACGIYMDDCLSGQTIVGNLLIDVGYISVVLGGGRDFVVQNNVVVNTRGETIHYDDRGIQGILDAPDYTWFTHAKQGESLWTDLYNSPWQSQLWQQRYPQYKNYSQDFSNLQDKNFPANPSYSKVDNNVIINPQGIWDTMCQNSYKYSEIQNNLVFKLKDIGKVFEDYQNGNYKLRDEVIHSNQLPNFVDLQLDQMGRY